MTKEERIKKYNPYKTKNAVLAKKLHKIMMDMEKWDVQDLLFSTGFEEYERYVSDCIDLKEMPIKYSEWISEQSKANFKQ